MPSPATILVVDESAPERAATEELLRQAGYRVVGAGSFDEAARVLDTDDPGLLITELRIGAFNGLHLVIRSRQVRPWIAAIVLTRFPDPVLEVEAHHERASYVVKPPDRDAFLALVSRKLGTLPDRRRAPRAPIAGRVEITVGNRPAALVDVSYEGFCIEMPGRDVPASLDVTFPTGLSIKAAPRWTRHPYAGVESVWCGAALSEVDATTARAWRAFVNAQLAV